jgi:hypothetical protein
MKHLALTTIPIFTIVLSCYPADSGTGSSGKSLDNYANGGVSQYNVCSPNPQSLVAAKDTVISAPTPEAHQAVANALSAVPQVLLRAFQAAGGKVVASSEAAKICNQIGQNTSEKDLTKGTTIPSCWLQETAGVAPQIVLSDDPVLIQHSMIRAFTYFFTEYFVTRVSHPDVLSKMSQSSDWLAAIQEFESHRDEVAEAFLRDLGSKNIAVASKFRSINSRDPLSFKNAVLAEVLDSCYCSQNTRNILRQQFPATWSVSKCKTL